MIRSNHLVLIHFIFRMSFLFKIYFLCNHGMYLVLRRSYFWIQYIGLNQFSKSIIYYFCLSLILYNKSRQVFLIFLFLLGTRLKLYYIFLTSTAGCDIVISWSSFLFLPLKNLFPIFLLFYLNPMVRKVTINNQHFPASI